MGDERQSGRPVRPPALSVSAWVLAGALAAVALLAGFGQPVLVLLCLAVAPAVAAVLLVRGPVFRLDGGTRANRVRRWSARSDCGAADRVTGPTQRLGPNPWGYRA